MSDYTAYTLSLKTGQSVETIGHKLRSGRIKGYKINQKWYIEEKFADLYIAALTFDNMGKRHRKR